MATDSAATARQFNIAEHYDTMAQLDADVHTNVELSESEVGLALKLLDYQPRSVFLPCFGTGRHIQALLQAGVQRIVGVDLSPACVAKAQAKFQNDGRVELSVGDLITWDTSERFDAVLLLGNSWGDCVDFDTMLAITRGMTKPLASGRTFVMDYIGQGYADHCKAELAVSWEATYNGQPVLDKRKPKSDGKIMTIEIEVTPQNGGDVLWHGQYQKLVLSELELQQLFWNCGITLNIAGRATNLNDYVNTHRESLGMIAASNWYIGV